MRRLSLSVTTGCPVVTRLVAVAVRRTEASGKSNKVNVLSKRAEIVASVVAGVLS